jgi:glycosyltransferase involved in cell wall biosynthesis
MILHFSHTNIQFDSRILKEMRALAESIELRVVGVGLGAKDAGGEVSSNPMRIEIYTLKLLTEKFKFAPKVIFYSLTIVELTLVLFFKGFRLQPRVVHCHDPFVLPAGWLLSLATGARLVYDAHELESDKNSQSYTLSVCTLLIERLAWRKIDLLISVSQSIVDWYCHKLGSKTSLIVLNSPEVVLNDIEIACHSLRNRFYISDNCPVFVYVGQLCSGRGIAKCLDVFAKLGCRAHIIFIGFGELKNSIIAHSQRYENIHLHEAVPHYELVPLISTADYGLCLIENVSLSDYYSLPNKFFEYCFAGLPILASDFPEMSKLVKNYSLGVCCVPTVDGIDSAIVKMIDMRMPRFEFVAGELAWSAQAEKLCGAYEALLGEEA